MGCLLLLGAGGEKNVSSTCGCRLLQHVGFPKAGVKIKITKMIQTACPGFSLYPMPFFSSHQEVRIVAAAEASDATPVPKANQSPRKITWRTTSHHSRSCHVLLLLMTRLPGQHWAAHRASTVNTNLLLPVLLCGMFWSPQCIKSDWDLYQLRETCSSCVGTPIHHDLWEGYSSWFCPHPLPRLRVEQVHGGRQDDKMRLGALPCPQQLSSYHHPCTWNSFPWVCCVPVDPLFCHINRHLAA